MGPTQPKEMTVEDLELFKQGQADGATIFALATCAVNLNTATQLRNPNKMAQYYTEIKHQLESNPGFAKRLNLMNAQARGMVMKENKPVIQMVGHEEPPQETL